MTPQQIQALFSKYGKENLFIIWFDNVRRCYIEKNMNPQLKVNTTNMNFGSGTIPFEGKDGQKEVINPAQTIEWDWDNELIIIKEIPFNSMPLITVTPLSDIQSLMFINKDIEWNNFDMNQQNEIVNPTYKGYNPVNNTW